MKKYFFTSIFVPVFFFIFVLIFFIPLFQNSNMAFSYNGLKISTSNYLNYFWPTPNYTRITSSFGYRDAPTKGASTYHGGIDIGAPEGSPIYSISDGTVIQAEFSGAGGYTVAILHSNNIISYYSHVSPNFIVNVGDKIKKGTLIAYVGPKYVENSPYKDKNGKSTNGATTGPHLHFAISISGKKIDPLTIFE